MTSGLTFVKDNILAGICVTWYADDRMAVNVQFENSRVIYVAWNFRQNVSLQCALAVLYIDSYQPAFFSQALSTQLETLFSKLFSQDEQI